jgi:2-C-methyl-D-erythritol 4-phosphate cytidylyltransferase
MIADKVTAIVLAAGQGKRMNSPVAKQFLILRDKPVLYYSLKTFEDSSVDDIILVTGRDQVEYCRKNIIDYFHFKKVSKIIEGGKERYDSVYEGLKEAESAEYVLIHDGARPFISTGLIENVIRQVKECKACVVGTPVKETIKVVNQDGIISSTPNRNTLWAAQTPQAFDNQAIRNAYELFYKNIGVRKELVVTDDAMVYETFLKRPVKVLLGEYDNLKITTPEDLYFAETILDGLVYEKEKNQNKS